MAIIDRLKVRLPEASDKDDLLNEFVRTITDRVMLRTGMPDELPTVPFESIVVDAAVKMYRRIYYEGIEQEKSAELTAKFVDDILKEYNAEIQGYLDSLSLDTGEDRVVRFI